MLNESLIDVWPDAVKVMQFILHLDQPRLLQVGSFSSMLLYCSFLPRMKCLVEVAAARVVVPHQVRIVPPALPLLWLLHRTRLQGADHRMVHLVWILLPKARRLFLELIGSRPVGWSHYHGRIVVSRPLILMALSPRWLRQIDRYLAYFLLLLSGAKAWILMLG